MCVCFFFVSVVAHETQAIAALSLSTAQQLNESAIAQRESSVAQAKLSALQLALAQRRAQYQRHPYGSGDGGSDHFSGSDSGNDTRIAKSRTVKRNGELSRRLQKINLVRTELNSQNFDRLFDKNKVRDTAIFFKTKYQLAREEGLDFLEEALAYKATVGEGTDSSEEGKEIAKNHLMKGT